MVTLADGKGSSVDLGVWPVRMRAAAPAACKGSGDSRAEAVDARKRQVPRIRGNRRGVRKKNAGRHV